MINMIKIGQKAVISRNIPSADGMLYADTKVTITNIIDDNASTLIDQFTLKRPESIQEKIIKLFW